MDRKELEKTLIRKLFANFDILIKKLDSLPPNLFSVHNYKRIFEVLHKKRDLLPQITPTETSLDILFREDIPTKETRELIISALLGMMQSKENPMDIDLLIKELKSLDLCNKLTKILKETAELIKPETIEQAYTNLLDSLLKIPLESVSYIHTQKITEIHESLEKDIDKIFSVEERSLPTCIKAFDIVTGGFKPTELITIAAPTGTGKSNILIWLAEQYVERGYNVVFFTLEMSTKEIGLRRAAMQTGVLLQDIKTNSLTEKEKAGFYIKLIASHKRNEIRKAFIKECLINNLHLKLDVEKLLKIASKYENRKNKLFIIDIPGDCTPAKIEQELIKIKQNYNINIDVCLVDFINVMQHNIIVRERPRELALIARELKLIARRQECLLITAAQLDATKAKNEGVSSESIKYSKGIIENSDWAMGFVITNEDKLLNQIKLKLIKHRHSAPATALLQFNFSNMQCKDLGFAEESEVPPGYTKDGDKAIYDSALEKEKNEKYNLLEEYNEILSEIEKKNNEIKKENIDVKIDIPEEDIEMLNRIKSIFPVKKISIWKGE